MVTLVNILLLLIFVASVLLIGLDVVRFRISKFAYNQLSTSERKALPAQVAQNLENIYRLQQIKLMGLSIIFALLMTWRRVWWQALIYSLVILLVARLIAKFRFVQNWSTKLFWHYAPWLIYIINYIKPFLVHTVGLPEFDGSFASKDELLDIVAHNQEALSSQQKRLLTHSLQFADKSVKSIMVSKSSIVKVRAADTLGPKLLDQLHAGGHAVLPVIKSSIDEIVGSLHLADLADMDLLQSGPKVSSLMRKQTYYIYEDASLAEALSAFMTTQHPQLVVINKRQKTLGLLTIKDLLVEMTGNEPVSEFTQHDDAEAVVAHATEISQPTEE